MSHSYSARLFKIGTIFFFHILLVYGLSTSDHTGLILVIGFLLHYPVHNLGNAIGYHKLFSHSSFVPVKWYPKLSAFLSSISFFGDPLTYAITHRLHHKYADTNKDPHSPSNGKIHAYIGWVLTFVPSNKDKLIISDLIRKYPWVVPYMKFEPVVPIIFYALLFYISTTAGLVVLLASVLAFQIALCVNMLAHSADNNGVYRATDNIVIATLVSSIFLHRSHHNTPSLYDYSQGAIYKDNWAWITKNILTNKDNEI